MEGMPAFEIYPMIWPVVGSVELLTEANIPGTLVTTELQVRALSALVKRRLVLCQKSADVTSRLSVSGRITSPNQRRNMAFPSLSIVRGPKTRIL
jgi:hypothetical protein